MGDIDHRRSREAGSHRLARLRTYSLKPPIADPNVTQPKSQAAFDCGWGRLIFAQTFPDPAAIAAAMRAEGPDRRDIAFYVRDPHVLLAAAPQELFLDPSHTYRLDLSVYRAAAANPRGFLVRRLTTVQDAEAVNRIYLSRGMVPVAPDFFWSRRDARAMVCFVVEDGRDGAILGTVTGVDHRVAFDDPEGGASLWCLAVDPQAHQPGIGEALVRRLAEHFVARGAGHLDLSVLHDNEHAIALYEKLGFVRVPLFTVKRKNPINEPLFTGQSPTDSLNPYAAIIVEEALRRGIRVDVIDGASGLFRLTYGARIVRCRESLSDFTTAVAMSICDDKAVTRRIVADAGLVVPDQIAADDESDVAAFLDRHHSVVVKPARGEQGRGVAVGLRSVDEVRAAVEAARSISPDVLIEAQAAGEDLRLVVIDHRVVAAAVRRPPIVVGDGRATIKELIAVQSRRRQAATGGESSIPLDGETERCVRAAGHALDAILPEGEAVAVRGTANLHTGGTIHDVTPEVHGTLIDAAVKASRAIDIPVVGIDLIVRSPHRPEYVFIEANERPGLANHEPQPTAERFIDLLFPLSVPSAIRPAVP